jgi:hypothetical protein
MKGPLMRLLVYILLTISLLFISCGSDETNSQDLEKNTGQVESNVHAGKVMEKMNSGSYSYLLVSENGNEYWIAVPQMEIAQGEMIYFSQFMEMKNFKSETLDRTFESILFVSDANKTQDNMNMQTGHTGSQPVDKNNVSIEKVSGGITIAEIYKDKDSLHRKNVKVRGKVVKFNGGIMDRNWIHIQDGTADGENFDLLITSKEPAAVGDIIVAEGEIVLDRDFGAGYSYAVLMENAKIIK